MAKRGRKPEPTELKLAKGTYRKNPQRRNHDEPEVAKGIPDQPDGLDEIAIACWKDTCQQMEDMRTLSPVFAKAIEQYARTWSQLKQVETMVADTGIVLVVQKTDGTVETRRNQFTLEMHKLADRLLKIQAELGLTPSSKSSVRASRPKGIPVRERG